MKHKLTLILLFAALATCLNTAPATAVTITFDVLDTFIEVGESFDVVVSVFDDSYVDENDPGLGDLIIFGFYVDPIFALITLDSVTFDMDYDDAGSIGNYVAGGYNSIGNAGQVVTLATLGFTAGFTPGVDSLAIEGPLDPLFTGLYYEWGDALISASTDITVNAPVPEPATILLLVSGMAGLGVFGRKRFKK